MTTITIPKNLIKKGEELIAIPRKDYERLLRLSAIEEGLRDLREGRVSPAFSSAKSAVRYLHRQAKKVK